MHSPTSTIEPLLTVAQAAAHLGMTASWLYDNYRPLAVPVYRLGGNLRFRRSELEDWLSNRQVAA